MSLASIDSYSKSLGSITRRRIIRLMVDVHHKLAFKQQDGISQCSAPNVSKQGLRLTDRFSGEKLLCY